MGFLDLPFNQEETLVCIWPVCGFKAKLENLAQISSPPCLEITHESRLLLSTASAQTFPLSSSISFSLSVRQTVCTADKYSHPEIHSFQVLFRCKSLHRSEKKEKFGSIASLSVLRAAAQVQLCILRLSLSHSTEAELVLKHSRGMKL